MQVVRRALGRFQRGESWSSTEPTAWTARELQGWLAAQKDVRKSCRHALRHYSSADLLNKDVEDLIELLGSKRAARELHKLLHAQAEARLTTQLLTGRDDAPTPSDGSSRQNHNLRSTAVSQSLDLRRGPRQEYMRPRASDTATPDITSWRLSCNNDHSDEVTETTSWAVPSSSLGTGPRPKLLSGQLVVRTEELLDRRASLKQVGRTSPWSAQAGTWGGITHALENLSPSPEPRVDSARRSPITSSPPPAQAGELKGLSAAADALMRVKERYAAVETSALSSSSRESSGELISSGVVYDTDEIGNVVDSAPLPLAPLPSSVFNASCYDSAHGTARSGMLPPAPHRASADIVHGGYYIGGNTKRDSYILDKKLPFHKGGDSGDAFNLAGVQSLPCPKSRAHIDSKDPGSVRQLRSMFDRSLFSRGAPVSNVRAIIGRFEVSFSPQKTKIKS